MPGFFNTFKQFKSSSSSTSADLKEYTRHYYQHDSPPEWAPAPESSHRYGRFAEASERDFELAEAFCEQVPPREPRLIPSNALDRIKDEGARSWGIEIPPPSSRFKGSIDNIGKDSKGRGVVQVRTDSKCGEVCLTSNLPIMAGMYDVQGKLGVYFEINIKKMDHGGIIALGTACLPYPDWRFPGWNRLSAGLHLDDMRKFCEDPEGGRDYDSNISKISPGDIVGCGYEFSTGAIFFTYNGIRLANAFSGLYLPRSKHDVFAAIGVEKHCEFEVNFGGDLFKWPEANEWQWKVDGLGHRFADTNQFGDDLPAYSE